MAAISVQNMIDRIINHNSVFVSVGNDIYETFLDVAPNPNVGEDVYVYFLQVGEERIYMNDLDGYVSNMGWSRQYFNFRWNGRPVEIRIPLENVDWRVQAALEMR